MGTDPAFQAVVDGTHLEIDGLVAAKDPLDAAQPPVGPYGGFGRESFCGHGGADDVDAAEGSVPNSCGVQIEGAARVRDGSC